jgi:LacI family transcriptional regulator
VRQPAYQIGTSAAELLFERVDDPATPHREISFTPELVVRDSSGQ